MTNSLVEMVNAFRITENVTENVIVQMAKMNRYVYAIQVSFAAKRFSHSIIASGPSIEYKRNHWH